MSEAVPTIPAEPVALPASPSDDLWTADSERSDPSPAATPEPTLELEGGPEPEPDLTAQPEIARDDKGQFKKPSGKPRNDPVARVQQATAREATAKEEARVAKEEAAALKARIAALEQARTPARPEPQAPSKDAGFAFPKLEAWLSTNPEKDWEDYQAAREDARDTWRDERAATRQQAKERQTTVMTYQEALGTALAADPVFAQAMQSAPLASDVMHDAIMASPKAVEITRYLSTHPEDCAQLARETEHASRDAVPMMRRYLEAQVTAGAVVRPDSASVVRPSTANPPINRVGGTVSATPVDPDDLPFGPEYIRAENLREKQRRETGSRW